jgi:hypothetical protein
VSHPALICCRIRVGLYKGRSLLHVRAISRLIAVGILYIVALLIERTSCTPASSLRLAPLNLLNALFVAADLRNRAAADLKRSRILRAVALKREI